MRPLTDDELKLVFEKLEKFLGNDVRLLLRPTAAADGGEQAACLRLNKQTVFLVPEHLMRLATNVARDALVSAGTTIGRFTKGGSFRLAVTCLDLLAKHSKHRVWIKPSSEMSFLYGNHIVKEGVARMTPMDTYDGVCVYNLAGTPLGFGIAAHPSEYADALDSGANVVLHQADVGEYLRIEAGDE